MFPEEGCVMKKYVRIAFEVEAVKYEVGKGIEDGFRPLSDVITQGFVTKDNLVQVTGENGVIMCPFVTSRRGAIFIREGDYVIKESSGDKHCCGGDVFAKRFRGIDE